MSSEVEHKSIEHGDEQNHTDHHAHTHHDGHVCDHGHGGFRKTGTSRRGEHTEALHGAADNAGTRQHADGSVGLDHAGLEDAAQIDFGASEGFFDARGQLMPLVKTQVQDRQFNELMGLSLDHHASGLIGHALLDTLEDQGLSVGDFDAVGALTAAALPMACAMVHAASLRGEDLDAFVMDVVFPSIKGPAIAGKRVLMLDAWLSEKSYVQTSSLVTLRNGNELGLDFGIIDHEGADIVGIAALVGGIQGDRSVIDVCSPIDHSHHELPFIAVFTEEELR